MAFFGSKGFMGMDGGFGDDGDTGGEIDNKELYESLELNTDATIDDIKKKFRDLAKKHHPDRGGDGEKFKEINAAYEVLSNPEKKKIYDKYGLEGLKNGGIDQSGFGSIFDIFFNRHSRGHGKPQGKPKMKPIGVETQINLYDAYHGKLIKVDVERTVLCADCDGKGGAKVETCTRCKGKGIQIKMVQLGPGMYSQSQSYCDDCNGKGKQIDKKLICKTCKGDQVKKKKEKVEVPIEVGFPNQEKIIIPGKGNENPDYETGDLVVIVTTEKSKEYERKGNDLYMTKKISLIESLCGFSFNHKHISDNEITIQTPPNKIIKHQETMKIPNLGMYHYRDSLSNGDLYIIFDVVFPEKLTNEQKTTLKQCLPKGLLPIQEPNKNVYDLQTVKEDFHSKKQQEQIYDEQEEHEHGGQRVECGTQ